MGLIKKRYCSVCDIELTSKNPLKDKNGNYFCFEHYKILQQEENLNTKNKQQRLLKD
jgi:hypothetical protein